MAKPIKGTKQDDLTLNGTGGNDMLLGKDGNDIIKGLGGNDKIDGGKGIDTAIFSGNFADYVLSFKPQGQNGHGNDDNFVTVSDINGASQVKNVEFLQFDDAMVNVNSGDTWVYAVNAVPDSSAQDPLSPGNLYAGSGIPATGFGLATNEGAGIELGLQVLYRQGPTVTTLDDYADGILHFSVNDGPQSTLNGSLVNNAARAAWNFTFSIATGLNGETTDLNDFTFKLLYDVDPTLGTSYRTLTLEEETLPQAAGQSGFQWRDDGTGLEFIMDDEGTANVTQNSENYAFGFFQFFLTGPYGPGNAFAGPAHFDIQLQAFDQADQLIGLNHIRVDVIL
jgi:hypothetical protein